MLLAVLVDAHQHQHSDLGVVAADLLVETVGIEVDEVEGREVAHPPLMELLGPGQFQRRQHRGDELSRALAEHHLEHAGDVRFADAL